MPKRLVIFVVFLLAYILSYFFRSTNAVIAGDLTRDFALSPDQLGLLTGVFFASFALVQLPLGPALDRYGPRRTTAVLLLFAVLGSLLFALAQVYWLVLISRVLIGIGVAGVLMGALKAFSNWFSAKRFATVSGIFVSLGASGALLATTPLALLNEAIGWRAVFLGGAGLTLVAALLLALFVKDKPEAEAIKVESKTTEDSVLDILRDIGFWRIAFLNFAIVGSFFAYQSLWMGPYLEEGLGRSSLSAGNLLFLLSSGSVIGYFISGWLADRFGLFRVIMISFTLYFLTHPILALFQEALTLSSLRVLLISFGFFGAFNIMLFSHIRKRFPAQLIGRALALTNLFGIGGSALLQWGLGLVLAFTVSNGQNTAAGFSAMFLITTGLGLLGLIFYAPFMWQTREQKGLTPQQG